MDNVEMPSRDPRENLVSEISENTKNNPLDKSLKYNFSLRMSLGLLSLSVIYFINSLIRIIGQEGYGYVFVFVGIPVCTAFIVLVDYVFTLAILSVPKNRKSFMKTFYGLIICKAILIVLLLIKLEPLFTR